MDNCTVIRGSSKKQQFSRNEKLAHKKGYRAVAGKVFSPRGNELKLQLTRFGYYRFGIMTGSRTDGSRKKLMVMVHRLVAYQTHGDEIYNHDCVRHRDGNSLNNMPMNIFLGSQSDNMTDVSCDTRMEKSIKAATKLRKFTDARMKEIQEQHVSYKKTMEKFGITSKGTLHHILNHEYKTTVTA